MGPSDAPTERYLVRSEETEICLQDDHEGFTCRTCAVLLQRRLDASIRAVRLLQRQLKITEAELAATQRLVFDR